MINLIRRELPARIKAVYYDANDIPPVILLSSNINNINEETCIIAEELGHYYTSSGDLLAISKERLSVIKQEDRARRWASKRLVSLEILIHAYEHGVQSRYDLAQFIGVTEEFLDWTLDYFKKHYGSMVRVSDIYTIYFEPLGVYKNIDLA